MNVDIPGLSRRFGSVTAVAEVDLQAGPGVFGLLGPNGAGKTSLLRMMATAMPPTSGRLRLVGRDPGIYGRGCEIRRRLGYLPQNPGYYPGFTVAEYVEYFALLKEVPPARIRVAVGMAIDRVMLGGRRKARLRTLSGGMLRRAGIAQAIVNEPELLLLVAIGLFWLITYRKTMAMPPLWNLRADSLQAGAVLDFAVPVTGAAAWMGSRESRRRVTDQVTITARPRWTRLLMPLAATTIWAMVAYLGCLAVLYGVTAREASWGGPLWWPAVVVAASLPAFSALGFVAGTFLPSRFTAPLAAIAAFFILALSTELIVGSQSYCQI